MTTDEWPISLPFEYANEEEAQWRHHDKPNQAHREHLTGWEADNRSGVKGRLIEVVHGYKGNNESAPRTFVVFEWRLVPGTSSDRIKNVTITVAFQAIGHRDGAPRGSSLEEWDPVPIRWAPNEPILSHFSHGQVSEDNNTEYGAQAGHEPYLALTGKRSKGSAQSVERINYRFITGSPAFVGKNSGTSNAMKWQLAENAQLKSGVQYDVRTAVLLRREEADFGKFNVTVVAEANGSRTARLLRALRIRPADGPAAFDPTVLPGSSKGESGDDDVAARATMRDWRNLDNVNVEEVLIKDWGVDSFEELDKSMNTTP